MTEPEPKPKPKRQEPYRSTGAKPRTVFLTDTETRILRAVGGGNLSEGLRQSITWAGHFYQLGLTDEMNLDCIGLVTVSSTDQHPHE